MSPPASEALSEEREAEIRSVLSQAVFQDGRSLNDFINVTTVAIRDLLGEVDRLRAARHEAGEGGVEGAGGHSVAEAPGKNAAPSERGSSSAPHVPSRTPSPEAGSAARQARMQRALERIADPSVDWQMVKDTQGRGGMLPFEIARAVLRPGEQQG